MTESRTGGGWKESSSPTLLLEQGHPGQAAQGGVQAQAGANSNLSKRILIPAR